MIDMDTTVTRVLRSFCHRHLLLAGLIVASLSACSSGPPAKLYLLESVSTDLEARNLSERPAFKSLGISLVELPGYVGDARITSVNQDGTVSHDDRHRWAEEPQAAISRVFSNRLRMRSGSTVLIEPWPRDFAPAARVEVVFAKLLREPLGGVDMAGQILLLSGDGRRLLKAVPFEFTLYGRDVNKQVFFTAVAQGVDDIARMTIQALGELGLKS